MPSLVAQAPHLLLPSPWASGTRQLTCVETATTGSPGPALRRGELHSYGQGCCVRVAGPLVSLWPDFSP